MSKSEILEWFSVNSESLQADRILFVMAMGLAIGAVIFLTYRLTFQGVCYNAKFNVSNVVLVLISATIMLMISSNIAISLGMVGALSIIRFRTAIKDPQDTVYIFWAVIEGLCIGAQIYKLAIISTVVVALLMIAGSFYSAFQKKYLLVIRGGGGMKQEDILSCIHKYYKKTKVRQVNAEAGHCEIILEVAAKGMKQELSEELSALPGVNGVNWLLEMGEYIG